jgi:GntR family transcriptional regulator
MKLKPGPVPLYYQVEQILRSRIESGELSVGQLIPTELELTGEFDVSRSTIRQAIGALEIDGLVRRERGRGTFVNACPPPVRTFKMHGTIQALHHMGDNTRIELFSKELIVPDIQTKKEMNLGKESKLYRFDGIRTDDKKHTIFFQILIPEEYGKNIDLTQDFNPPQLINQVEQSAGQTANRVYQTIRTVPADSKVSKLIGVPPGQLLIFTKRLYVAEDGRTLELAINYIPGEDFFMESELVRSED